MGGSDRASRRHPCPDRPRPMSVCLSVERPCRRCCCSSRCRRHHRLHHLGGASRRSRQPLRSEHAQEISHRLRVGDPLGARSVPERREPSHQRVAPARGARRRDGPGGLMIMMIPPMAVPRRSPGVCARTYCACACCVSGVVCIPLVAIVIAGQPGERGSIVQLSPAGGCSCLAHEAHAAVGAPMLGGGTPSDKLARSWSPGEPFGEEARARGQGEGKGSVGSVVARRTAPGRWGRRRKEGSIKVHQACLLARGPRRRRARARADE